MATQLADRYEDSNVSLSLPFTRMDAFTITLANELSRNGRRSGLTFAPEGGSERMRKVINKTVDEDDLIRTVATAYANGWRQVKLYFMCGLPTETDEDVLAIADLDRRVIETGRREAGTKDIRCTLSNSGFVPNHTRRSTGRRNSTWRRPTRGCSSRGKQSDPTSNMARGSAVSW